MDCREDSHVPAGERDVRSGGVLGERTVITWRLSPSTAKVRFGRDARAHRRNIIAAQNSDLSEDGYGDVWHSTHLEPFGKNRVTADP